MPLIGDATLWAGSHMRARSKQVTARCGGEKIQWQRAVRYGGPFLYAPSKTNEAQQQMQEEMIACNPKQPSTCIQATTAKQ
ncbi:hypothetical protein DVQ15_22070 [Yersinia enterocolitica]|nr:hypothetical protein [Yersinia enterocolitica]